jgi:hypothetical protein
MGISFKLDKKQFPDRLPVAFHGSLRAVRWLVKSPTQAQRNAHSAKRIKVWRRNREFFQPIPKSSPHEFFDTERGFRIESASTQ